MNGPETVNAVIRMQDYIHQNIDENITLDALCSVSGYSKRHSLRIFKELLHKTPCEYIRDFKMTLAAKRLINPGSSERVLRHMKALQKHFIIISVSRRKNSASAPFRKITRSRLQ